MENSGNRRFVNQLSVNKRFFLLLFLSGIICRISPAYAVSIKHVCTSDTLTVMTYNIHHGRGLDGNIDLNRISGVIIRSKADIVALQEVDIETVRSGGVDVLHELSVKTGLKHTVFGMNLEFEGGKYGNAILSRYPITNSENHHFENISGEQRGVLTASIDINNKSILIINTHLDHSDHNDSERVLFAESIRDNILPLYKNYITIFAGDMNDIPGSRTYQIISSSLFDSWDAVGKGNGFTIPADQPTERIDYIFHSRQLKPIFAKVVQSRASDHLPVVVTYTYIND